MGLKAVVTNEELQALPEPVRAFYKQDGTNYVLDADVDAHPAVAGLRNTVAATRGERDTLKQQLQAVADKYKDIDPDKAREAMVEIQKLNDKKLIDEGKVEELLHQRTERMRLDHENQIAAYKGQVDGLKGENTKLTSRLEEVLIDTGLTQAAIAAGVRQSAIPDVILRGRRIWRLKDGTPTPYRNGGQDVLFGKDPQQPIGMDEWVASLATDAPHLFEPNAGARTDPGRTGAKPGRIVLTREEARDPAIWRAKQAEAAKTGAVVEVQQ